MSPTAFVASEPTPRIQHLLNSSPLARRILGSLTGASHESDATVRRLRPILPSTSPSAEAVLLLCHSLSARAPAPMAKAAPADRRRLSRQPNTRVHRVAQAPPGLLVQLSRRASCVRRAQSRVPAHTKPSTTVDCKDGCVIRPSAAPLWRLPPAAPLLPWDCKDGRVDGPDRSTASGQRSIES